jgi:hypothetical protein
VLPIHAAAADDAPPRPLLAVFETAGLSLPQGPLPDGLRFVLYDDCQVLVRSGPTQANPDPPGRGVTYGRLGRDAAESLHSEASDALKNVRTVDSGYAGVADAGITILEVWDGDRYRRFTADAWPCQGEGRNFTAGIWKRIRDETDPQFLKACDRLLQYRIPAPQPWTPKSAQLVIGTLDGPAERQVDWPKSWPPAPPDLKPKAGTYFCAAVALDPRDFSNTLITARWGDIGRTALTIDATTSAVIWDWYFDLPAAIPTLNEKGEPDGAAGNACPEAARP